MKNLLIYKKILLLMVTCVFIISCSKGSNNESLEPIQSKTKYNEQSSDLKIFSDQWFGFYFKGNKLGYLHSIGARVSGGYMSKSYGVVSMQTEPGISQQTSISEQVYMDDNYNLTGFEYVLNAGENRISLTGSVDGKTMQTVIETGGKTEVSREDISGSLFSSVSFKIKAIREGIKPGVKYDGNVYFQPMKKIASMSFRVGNEGEIEISGKKLKAFPVYEEIGGFKSTSWVSANGDIIKEESFEGFELIADNENNAKRLDSTMHAGQFLKLAQVKTDKEIEEPSRVNTLKIQFCGLGNKAKIPERDYQAVSSEEYESGSGGKKSVTVEIVKPKIGTFKTLVLPITFYQQYLKPTQFIQSDNEKIKKIAADISEKSGNDSVKFIRYGLEWQNDNIRTSMTENFTALDTLKSGEGECQSNANLFSSIMRAGSVSCRIVTGIVYPEGGSGFMYHAWCEVYIGKWIAVDPTFKQFPADATHVILADGDIFSQIGIINFIDNSGIKILKVNYD